MATIVGVAVDADTLRTNAETSVVYLPLAQHFTPDVMVIARGASIEHANRLVGSLRDAIRGVDPAIPISFAGRGDLMLGARWVVARVAVEVVWALSLFALIVTMVGLYGVLAQVVAMRRAEMGVRMALGATPGQVLGLVFRDGSAPVAIGLAAGVGLAAIGRLSAQPLFTRAVSAIDVPVALLAATPLVIAAAIACYLPARRASRVDPMRVLKEL
jgi:putative ABC transport system permease protein